MMGGGGDLIRKPLEFTVQHKYSLSVLQHRLWLRIRDLASDPGPGVTRSKPEPPSISAPVRIKKGRFRPAPATQH